MVKRKHNWARFTQSRQYRQMVAKIKEDAHEKADVDFRDHMDDVWNTRIMGCLFLIGTALFLISKL